MWIRTTWPPAGASPDNRRLRTPRQAAAARRCPDAGRAGADRGAARALARGVLPGDPGQHRAKAAAIENARAKEGVLTGDISALSSGSARSTREIASLRRRESARRRTRSTRGARSWRACRLATRSSTSVTCGCAQSCGGHRSCSPQRLVEIYKSDQPDLLSRGPRVRRLRRPARARRLPEPDRQAGLGDRRPGARAEEEVRAEAALLLILKSQAEEAVRRSRPSSASSQEARAGDPEQRGATWRTRAAEARQARQREGAPPRARGRPRGAQAASAQVTDQLQGAARRPPARSARAAAATSGP